MGTESVRCVELKAVRAFLYPDTGEVYIGLTDEESADSRQIASDVYIDLNDRGDVIGLSVLPTGGILDLVLPRELRGSV